VQKQPGRRLYGSKVGREQLSPGIAVAVVPESYYRKPKGVQFKRSFRRRENAVRYAEQNRCRVVIAREDGHCYDVLCDPNSSPGPRVSFELVVDRGEMIAVPILPLPEDELPEFSAESETHSNLTSAKIAWSFVQNWLRA
jgi:hypothetical protein